MEHGVVLARGKEIEPKDLPASVRDVGSLRAGAASPKGTLQLGELERQAMEAALLQTGHNVTEAAKLLGISRRTLHRKLADAKKG